MNNETKEAIEYLKRLVGQIDATDYIKAIRLAITALERMDKVKFVTDEELDDYCERSEMAKYYTYIKFALKDFGILIESEKRCRWECIVSGTPVITTNKYTRSEMADLKGENSGAWHPVKEEE